MLRIWPKRSALWNGRQAPSWSPIRDGSRPFPTAQQLDAVGQETDPRSPAPEGLCTTLAPDSPMWTINGEVEVGVRALTPTAQQSLLITQLTLRSTPFAAPGTRMPVQLLPFQRSTSAACADVCAWVVPTATQAE